MKDKNFEKATKALIDFAKCAIEYLADKVEWRAVDRPAKAGDFIRLKEALYTFNEIGDILKVNEGGEGGCNVLSKDHPRETTGNETKWNYCSERYEVVELVLKKEEKKEEKPKFVPHLESLHGEHYGYIGEQTNYKDAIGRPLCVGDTVELYKGTEYHCETAVVKAHLGYGGRNLKAFIMGIADRCDQKTGYIDNGWQIIKKRSYEDVADGEKVYGVIKYIKH